MINLREVLRGHSARQDAQLAVIRTQLESVDGKLNLLLNLGVKTVATIADLKAKVDAEGTVIDSAVTLLNGLSQQLKDAVASNDPAAVQAVIDEVDAHAASLAAAVAANTPATPPTA